MTHPHATTIHPHPAITHPHPAIIHPHAANTHPHPKIIHPLPAMTHPHKKIIHPHSAIIHPLILDTEETTCDLLLTPSLFIHLPPYFAGMAALSDSMVHSRLTIHHRPSYWVS
ncbi:hypothetical protein [Marinoscillum furvescens]|uniref:hypothetical protein n=1 Tax=Marinoscillum furvescens TaxID=1026 RepID=UPI0014730657|nr:hypothetical protein [Marinoscillum furvescens]